MHEAFWNGLFDVRWEEAPLGPEAIRLIQRLREHGYAERTCRACGHAVVHLGRYLHDELESDRARDEGVVADFLAGDPAQHDHPSLAAALKLPDSVVSIGAVRTMLFGCAVLAGEPGSARWPSTSRRPSARELRSGRPLAERDQLADFAPLRSCCGRTGRSGWIRPPAGGRCRGPRRSVWRAAASGRCR